MASMPTLSPAELARDAMIESQLMPCGIVRSAVVTAFHAIPRHLFVAPERAALAYVDAEQPMGGGRTMMPPLSLGYLMQHAGPVAGERVLVVAAGTGYSAALLAHMGAHVTALEEDPALAARARETLASVGAPDVAVVEGPIAEGWPAHAPYGLMHLDGAVETLPPSLIAQLAEGGRVAAIVRGEDGVMRASIGRMAAGRLRFVAVAEAAAPIIPVFRKAEGFRF